MRKIFIFLFSFFWFFSLDAFSMVILLNPENGAILSSNSAYFDWWDSDSISTNSYVIKMRTDGSFRFSRNHSSGSTLVNLAIDTFPRGESIYWKVGAISGSDTVWASEFYFQRPCNPEIPTLTSPPPNFVTSNPSLTFSWTSPGCNSQFRQGIKFSTGRIISPATSPTVLDTVGFPKNQWIYWEVFVANGNDTTWSEKRRFWVNGACDPERVDLCSPPDSSIFTLPYGDIVFRWTEVSCAQLSQFIVFSNGQRFSVTGTEYRRQANLFPTGQFLTWKIITKNSNGDSAISHQVWRFKIVNPCQPSRVHLIAPPDSSIIPDTTKQKFSWSSDSCNGSFRQGVKFSTGQVVLASSGSFSVIVPLSSFPSSTWTTWRVFVANGSDTVWSYETWRFKTRPPCNPQIMHLVSPKDSSVIVDTVRQRFSWTEEGCNRFITQGVRFFTTGQIVLSQPSNTFIDMQMSQFPKNQWILWRAFATNGVDTSWSLQGWRFMVKEPCEPQKVHLIKPINNYETLDSVLIFKWTSEPCNDQYDKIVRLVIGDSTGREYTFYVQRGKGDSLVLDISFVPKGLWVYWDVGVIKDTTKIWSYDSWRFRFKRGCGDCKFHLLNPISGTVRYYAQTGNDESLCFRWTKIPVSGVSYTVFWYVEQDSHPYFSVTVNDTVYCHSYSKLLWPAAIQNKNIRWKVLAISGTDSLWAEETDWWFRFEGGPTSVEEKFMQEYNVSIAPNPGPYTNVSFVLPKEEHVTIEVYSSTGGVVEQVINGRLSSGTHQFRFLGENLPAGMYFMKVNFGIEFFTRSIVLIK